MAQLNLGIVASSETLTLEIESMLEQDIRKGQLTDDKIAEYRKWIKLGKVPEFREDEQGTVWFKNRICVPEIKEVMQHPREGPGVGRVQASSSKMHCTSLPDRKQFEYPFAEIPYNAITAGTNFLCGLMAPTGGHTAMRWWSFSEEAVFNRFRPIGRRLYWGPRSAPSMLAALTSTASPMTMTPPAGSGRTSRSPRALTSCALRSARTSSAASPNPTTLP
jgi:hypothetical protein